MFLYELFDYKLQRVYYVRTTGRSNTRLRPLVDTVRQKREKEFLTPNPGHISGRLFISPNSIPQEPFLRGQNIDKRARITAEGFVIIKEALSADQWVPYNMKGIFTITKMVE